jgi:hypothetical protein
MGVGVHTCRVGNQDSAKPTEAPGESGADKLIGDRVDEPLL